MKKIPYASVFLLCLTASAIGYAQEAGEAEESQVTLNAFMKYVAVATGAADQCDGADKTRIDRYETRAQNLLAQLGLINTPQSDDEQWAYIADQGTASFCNIVQCTDWPKLTCESALAHFEGIAIYQDDWTESAGLRSLVSKKVEAELRSVQARVDAGEVDGDTALGLVAQAWANQ